MGRGPRLPRPGSIGDKAIKGVAGGSLTGSGTVLSGVGLTSTGISLTVTLLSPKSNVAIEKVCQS